jgi:Tfp pilus assembly protein PilF
MLRAVLSVVAAGVLSAAAPRTYEIRGRILPPSPAAVSLFGATTPFHADATAGENGAFRFRALLPGQYTIAVLLPGRGELRQTIDLGPATSDPQGRASITIRVDEDHPLSREAIVNFTKVSTRELSIPESARREYAEAEKQLARREVNAAVTHLQKAVSIAPQFTNAWNTLGTIAYQTRDYQNAEKDFRAALEQNPAAYEPLVNLGGTLLSEDKAAEALNYNRDAVRSRPDDALANAQLGMNYAALGNLDLGQQYLEIAKRIDPGHFSYPQLTLARIHLERNERAAAAEELRDFLAHHPDSPRAGAVREQLQSLEK